MRKGAERKRLVEPTKGSGPPACEEQSQYGEDFPPEVNR